MSARVHEVERVGIASVAKIFAVINLAWSAVTFVPAVLLLGFLDVQITVVALAVSAVASVLGGALLGAFLAGIYNLLSVFVGGIRIQLS